MKKRLYTALGMVVVLALAFVLKMFVSNYFFDALILGITAVSAYEMTKILAGMGKYINKYVIMAMPALLMTSSLVCIAFDSQIGLIWSILINIGILAVAFLVTFLVSFLTKKSSINEIKFRKLDNTSLAKFSLRKAFNTLFGMVYPSFLLMFMTFINHIDEMTTSFPKVVEFGGYLSFVVLLFAFLIPSFTDTFAYLTGGLIGGKKLAPKISPNKTISGAVGGTIWCVLLCICTYFILNAIPAFYQVFNATGFAFWQILLISLFGSVIAQGGDLFESLLKRYAGLKDSGRIFPGHGGMLDRCDSYIYVSPYLLLAFGILVLLI